MVFLAMAIHSLFCACHPRQELARRLTAYFAAADSKPAAARPAGDDTAGSNTGPFSITFEDSLPLQVCVAALCCSRIAAEPCK